MSSWPGVWQGSWGQLWSWRFEAIQVFLGKAHSTHSGDVGRAVKAEGLEVKHRVERHGGMQLSPHKCCRNWEWSPYF